MSARVGFRGHRAVGTALGLVLAAGACDEVGSPLPSGDPDRIAPAPAAEVAPPDLPLSLTLEQLRAGTYQLPQFDGVIVRLRDGEFQDPASRRVVTLAPDPRLEGDFDGDGEPEVIALLVVGSALGIETNLVALGSVSGRMVQEAVISLGPGVTVRSLRSRDRAILVEALTTPRPGSPPRPPEMRRYVLDPGSWSRVD
ncbi:MAG: hypothetical protein RQ745_12210 [Longimicrobiales bacterium]|nr:hypothetical protein [Longimicrobiales bacterium]